MDDALDVQLNDQVLVDEIHLVTELIVVATMAPGELDQDLIDEVLGVHPVRTFFPQQRLG